MYTYLEMKKRGGGGEERREIGRRNGKRERESERGGGWKQKEVSLLGRLLQLLDVQLTDLVISVYSINGVTEYLMEEWQSNNLHVHVHENLVGLSSATNPKPKGQPHHCQI